MPKRTYTYPCGHQVTAKYDGRRVRGGVRVMRITDDIQAGRLCHRCRKQAARNRIQRFASPIVALAALDLMKIEQMEDLADRLEND